MKVTIRAFKPDIDSGIIYSSYPKGVYHGSYKPIEADKDQWFQDFYSKVKEQLASANILIACLDTDPDTILGYSIISGDVLEFVYVKELHRKQGIGSLLTNNKFKKINDLTLTKVGQAIMANREKVSSKNE